MYWLRKYIAAMDQLWRFYCALDDMPTDHMKHKMIISSIMIVPNIGFSNFTA